MQLPLTTKCHVQCPGVPGHSLQTSLQTWSSTSWIKGSEE